MSWFLNQFPQEPPKFDNPSTPSHTHTHLGLLIRIPTPLRLKIIPGKHLLELVLLPELLRREPQPLHHPGHLPPETHPILVLEHQEHVPVRPRPSRRPRPPVLRDDVTSTQVAALDVAHQPMVDVGRNRAASTGRVGVEHVEGVVLLRVGFPLDFGGKSHLMRGEGGTEVHGFVVGVGDGDFGGWYLGEDGRHDVVGVHCGIEVACSMGVDVLLTGSDGQVRFGV